MQLNFSVIYELIKKSYLDNTEFLDQEGYEISIYPLAAKKDEMYKILLFNIWTTVLRGLDYYKGI